MEIMTLTKQHVTEKREGFHNTSCKCTARSAVTGLRLDPLQN